MYKSIKLNNQSCLNIKKSIEKPINSSIFPQKIPPQVARPGEPLTTPSVLLLTQPSEGNSHQAGRGCITLPLRVLIPKNLSTLKSNISFLIELLDKFLTRQVRSLMNEIALEYLIE